MPTTCLPALQKQSYINSIDYDSNRLSTDYDVTYIDSTGFPVVSELEKLFSLRDKKQVFNFINRFPTDLYALLLSTLVEAGIYIKRYFPESTLYLRYFTDPEAFDEDHLIILIGTKLKPKEALKKLDHVYDFWAYDALDRLNGALTINLEFQKR